MSKKKFGRILSFIVVLIMLSTGTAFIYFYSKGYRIDILNQEIEKTGVITIETTPRRAKIFLDGKQQGTSPKALTGISEGEHTILIQKDGYQDWSMKVNVLAEQSIPIVATLFYTEPKIENILLPDVESYVIDKFFTDENNQIAIFTVINTEQTILQVWGYPINRRFWELEINPYLITEFNILTTATDIPTAIIDSNNYDILISPNSQRAILATTVNSENAYFLFYTDRYIEEPTELDNLVSITRDLLTWSKDSQYLIYTKNNELRTINLESEVQTVITEKNTENPFVWTSTDTSQIYYVENTDEDYNIIRTQATGDNQSIVLENIVSLSKLSYTEDIQTTEYIPTQIEVPEDGDYIVIMEKSRILVYSFKNDKFLVYMAENPEFISFSPDSDKFMYKNGINPNLFEYNLTVSEGDPIHVVGPRMLLDVHTNFTTSYLQWDPEQMSVIFSHNNADTKAYTIGGVSIDGLNNHILQNLSFSDKFAIGNSGKYIIGVCEGYQLCNMTVRE